MQKSGSSRGGHSKSSALEAEFLHRQLSNADLIKRLKVVTELLEEYGDEEDAIEKAKSETFHISSCLGEEWLLEHKNKDVRLLVACALADILRIFAPEPPYEEETNADVIKLFIKILRGFQSPDMTPQHPSYSIHFYLLERLSNIAIFSIIPELENFRDELLKMLVQAAYDVAGDIATHHATSKVMDHLISIICSVVEDMALLSKGIQVELLDLMVCALCQEEKRKNPNGYAMMRKVIASCPTNFQPFLERQLHQVKTGIQLDSDLTNKDRLAEAVFELSTAAPKCLTGVLGAFAEDLTIEDEELRIKAVKLLGAIFSVGSYFSDFSQAFSEFKRRSCDKDPDVRKALVNVMQALVTKRPEMGKLLMEDDWNYMGGSREAPLRQLVIDPDEGVRKEAVSAVLSACLVNSDSVPHGIVAFVADRVVDKRPAVRKQAMEGLAALWQKYCAPFDAARMPKGLSDKFGWIPSKILSLPVTDIALRSLVLHCVEDICLSPLNEERSAAEVAMEFFASLEEKAKESLVSLLKLRGRFCDQFVKFCELREQMATDMDLDDGEKKEADMLQKLGQYFSDTAGAQDNLDKLNSVKSQSGTKVWQLFEKLVKEPAGNAGTAKVQEELLKRLGPKHPQLSFVKTLVARLSDKCFGVDFIHLVLDSLVEDENRAATPKKCLSLIPELAVFNKNLVLGQEQSLEALMTAHCDDSSICQSVLKTIAVAGQDMPALAKSKSTIETIRKLCSHDSWVVAKFSVRALVATGHVDMNTLSKVAQEAAGHVSFGNKLPSALRVISEVARACPQAVAKEKETVMKFVRKRLLQGAWPASAGKKDRHVVIDSKVQGLKLLTVLSFQGNEDDITDLVSLCEEIITNGGEIQSGDNSTSKADKVVLRIVAGACILKVAKEGGPQSCLTPTVFASLSRLFEDEDRTVKEAMMKKVYRGTAIEKGKLPFRFASLFAMVVHDAEAVIVERGKNFLRNTLLVMAKLKNQTGSEAIALMSEHIFSWLVHILVCHQEYADQDEDSTQIGLAYKKYFELFFNCVPSDDQNMNAMQQVLHYIQQCAVPAGAAAQRSARVIDRNISLAVETAGRILLNKRWGTKGFENPSSVVPKIVDTSIFCFKSKGKGGEEKVLGALNPAPTASGSSMVVSKKSGRPSKPASTLEHKSPAMSIANSPAKSPKKRNLSSGDIEQSNNIQMNDDHNDGVFDFEDGERCRRPDSIGNAPLRGQKVSASGGHSEQQGKGCHVRDNCVPQKGDVLEFEMAEESAPGGVEWLSGTVLKVDAKKKSFAALIKDDDNDKSTWNEESYKFSDEGKEWRWPARVPSSSKPQGRKSAAEAIPQTAAPSKVAPLANAISARSEEVPQQKAKGRRQKEAHASEVAVTSSPVPRGSEEEPQQKTRGRPKKEAQASEVAVEVAVTSSPVPKADASKATPVNRQSKASPSRKPAPKAASPGVMPSGRASEVLRASGKKTPATKRKESTPFNAFDNFDEEDSAAAGALSLAKSKSPAGGSKPSPAKARASAVVAKARASDIVNEDSSQALWAQALAGAQECDSDKQPLAVKAVKRRRI